MGFLMEAVIFSLREKITSWAIAWLAHLRKIKSLLSAGFLFVFGVLHGRQATADTPFETPYALFISN